jgi:Uma2 family endonuclease
VTADAWYRRSVTTIAEPTDLMPPDEEWLSDEPLMDNSRHTMQQLLLISTLQSHWRDLQDYFCCGILSIFYNFAPIKKLGPDFFVALGVDPRDRGSWMVWREDGRYPDVIVELLTDSTAANDRGEKKQIYQDVFRTPAYFLFDPQTLELEGYRLSGGKYRRIEPDAKGLLECEPLGLSFGVRDGRLRYFTPDGVLVETPEEISRRLEEENRHLRAELDALRRT